MRDENTRWQQILSLGFSSVVDLLDFLEIPLSAGSPLAELSFATRVPRGFAQRMQKGDRHDPLLRQVLPVEEELDVVDGFVTDPLHEKKNNPQAGLIHKYQGRVLLTITGACAVNCRYCFRRHFPYQENNPGRAGWSDVMAYIQADSTVHEVILSGGDPLLVNDNLLLFLIQKIEAIAHVTTLRIHTRLPVVLPVRVNEALCSMLQRSRLQCVVVLHANHPQELSEDVKRACSRLRAAGCHVLNQSVLLRGVNDDVTVLTQLSERLFACGVLPYYLHVLDKVQGAAHFNLPEEKAYALFEELQRRLPGYLVPRLTREEPGRASKTLLFRGKDYVEHIDPVNNIVA